MMLDHMGWKEASGLIRVGLQSTIKKGIVTYDLARQIKDAKEVRCSEFAVAIVKIIGGL